MMTPEMQRREAAEARHLDKAAETARRVDVIAAALRRAERAHGLAGTRAAPRLPASLQPIPAAVLRQFARPTLDETSPALVSLAAEPGQPPIL